MNKPRCLSKQDPKKLLENIASDLFKATHEILDQNQKINLTPEYCYNEGCMQTGICLFNKGKSYFLNNNYIVLN